MVVFWGEGVDDAWGCDFVRSRLFEEVSPVVRVKTEDGIESLLPGILGAKVGRLPGFISNSLCVTT